MNNALRELTGKIADLGLGAVLVTDPKHVYYLTGFATNPHERFLGLVLQPDEEPALILPALDEEKARTASSVSRLIAHTDSDDPYALLQKLLDGRGGTVGIEKEHLSVARFDRIRQAAPEADYIDIGPALRAMRSRKTPDEVQRMRRAAELVEEVLRRGLTHIKPGVTEADLVAELEYQMKKVGAEGPSFDTMVLSGPNTALPHGVPGSRKLQPRELVMFDLGVFADGYASDITRTFALEEAEPELARIYNTVLEANLAGIAAAIPGQTYGSVDRAARRVIEDAGYGPYFMHRVGHGLGMDEHEYPSLHSRNEDLVETGNVFTVEPGIYVPGTGGVRIEDEVYVSPEGAVTLTSFPKELTVLPFGS